MNGKYNIFIVDLYIKKRGETSWPDKKKYTGEYLDDKKHGFGVFDWGNNKRYEGQWHNGK